MIRDLCCPTRVQQGTVLSTGRTHLSFYPHNFYAELRLLISNSITSNFTSFRILYIDSFFCMKTRLLVPQLRPHESSYFRHELFIYLKQVATCAWSPNCRGVQYVHWVMHKCIMVKVGGGNTHKVCKKLVNFPKTGVEICESRGGNNFRQSGGKCTKTGKIGVEIQNLWSMTKKKGREKVTF